LTDWQGISPFIAEIFQHPLSWLFAFLSNKDNVFNLVKISGSVIFFTFIFARPVINIMNINRGRRDTNGMAPWGNIQMHHDLEERILNASERIFISGATMNTLCHGNLMTLIEGKLMEGVKVEIVTTKSSSILGDLNFFQSQLYFLANGIGTFSRRKRELFKVLRVLFHRAKIRGYDLQIKTINAVLPCALVAVDDQAICIENYLFGIGRADIPPTISKLGDQLYAIYRTQVTYLHENSESWMPPLHSRIWHSLTWRFLEHGITAGN
jgi:hypothetical protein